MNSRIDKCPTCRRQLEVRELHCPACDISVKGTFTRCEFCSLPEDLLAFLRLFVSRRGNLREVERELGLSYPTVRARLDDLLRALGYPVSPTAVADRHERRRQVMEDLKAGKLSPEEAIRTLKQ
jgi:hypothetical protein